MFSFVGYGGFIGEWNRKGVDLLAAEAGCAAAVNDRPGLSRILVQLTHVFCFLLAAGVVGFKLLRGWQDEQLQSASR